MESHAYAELGPTRRLTSPDAEPPSKPRKVPGAIQRLIGELGLRYRPSAQADLEAHAATLALLASDLADVPPTCLAKAVEKWARESHFMPRASELIALAQSFMPKRDPGSVDRLHALAASLNASKFAAAYGWHYRVAINGEGMAYLDRVDS